MSRSIGEYSGLVVSVLFLIGIISFCVFHQQPVEKEEQHQFPKTPAFVYCVEGETSLVYEHSIGPITILDDGYLTFETRDAIIRVDGRSCVIEWRINK